MITYRTGIIGACGDVAPMHIDAISGHSRFQLRAVCDADTKKLAALAGPCRWRKHEDADLLLADEELDVVVICTPNHLHHEFAIKALDRRKHALCEKPFTTRLRDAREVAEVARGSGTTCVVSYHFAFRPEVACARDDLLRGSAVARFAFRSSEHLAPGKDWNYLKYAGGVWLDWAPNALSVLRAVLANSRAFESAEILECRMTSLPRHEIDTAVRAVLRLNGIEGELQMDWEAPPGVCVTQTILDTHAGERFVLDHAHTSVARNGEAVWQGEDNRYFGVYCDLAGRLDAGQSNIDVSLQEMTLIERGFRLAGW